MNTRSQYRVGSSLLSALFLIVGCSSASDPEGAIPEPGAAGSGTSAGGSSSPIGGSAPVAASGSGSGVAGSTGTAGGGNPGGAGQAGGSATAGSPTTGGTSADGGTSNTAGTSAAGGGGNAAQGGMGGTSGAGQAGGSSGGTSSGGGSNPDDKTIPMTIPTATNGQGEIRNTTTVLKSAANGGKDVWDFNNQRIGVNNTVECEGSEGQLTVFEVEDGVTVRNLIIAGGVHGGNGIVCKGSCTLEYVYWEDVCEDAATNSKDGATMRLNHVIALKASDKVFQHNAKGNSKTILQNSYVDTFGKLWRSCGDCTANGGPRHLEIDNVRVNGISTAVAGANQNYGDTVTIKNLFVKGGWDSGKDKPKICTEYIGVTDHNGESSKVGDGKSQWDTATCKVSQSDVKSY